MYKRVDEWVIDQLFIIMMMSVHTPLDIVPKCPLIIIIIMIMIIIKENPKDTNRIEESHYTSLFV